MPCARRAARARRTAHCTASRRLSWLPPPLRALRERNQLDTRLVDDVVLGCVTPVGEQGADIARVAALDADYAEQCPGVQINRFCASGLEAVNMAAAQMMSGQCELAIGGGVESMSRVPMGSDGGAWPIDPQLGHQDLLRAAGHLSRPDRHQVRASAAPTSMPTRSKASSARRPPGQDGHFEKSIVPVRDLNGLTMLAHDEHMRPETTLQSLAALKPAFADMGEKYGFDAVIRCSATRRSSASTMCTTPATVRASSTARPPCCSAARTSARRMGLKPRARIRAFASIGSEPSIMLTGPSLCRRRR